MSDLQSGEWVDVAPRSRVPANGMVEAEAAGVALLLIDLAGTIHATAAICPHHAAWLSQGGIDGSAIDCPRHQGRFDIASGRKLRGPDCPDLKVYPVREIWRDSACRIEVQLSRKAARP